MTEREVVTMLWKAVDESGQRELARRMKCSAAFINDVLRGRRYPTGPILRYFGLERVVERKVSYRKIKK